MTLEVTIEEYSTIRNAMTKRPFEEIAALVVKLDEQIIRQQESEKKHSYGEIKNG